MSTQHLNPADQATRETVGVTIIYEDRATGLRARRFSDMLVAALGCEDRHALSCWRCELITLPPIAREMARDAANSEFVILSLCGQASFSATMKEWIESWLLAGNRPASLIALFDPARSIAPRAERDRRYLRRLAQEAGVAFFAHCAAGSMSLEVNPPEEHPTPQPLLRSRPRLGAFRPASAVAAILTSAVA